MTAFHPAVAGQIVTRDRGCCARCGRYVAHEARGIGWSLHHRRRRGSGGSSLPWVSRAANGVLLCGSGTTGCHGVVESRPKEARLQGFVVALNGLLRAVDVPVVHAVHGFVYLTDDGGVVAVEGGG